MFSSKGQNEKRIRVQENSIKTVKNEENALINKKVVCILKHIEKI